MSDVADQKTLFCCFRDPVSSGTNEEGALRFLSRYPPRAITREIRDRWVDHGGHAYGSSLLHYACYNR